MDCVIYKTPAELDYYTIDYTDSKFGQGGATISTSAWSANDPNLTVNSPAPSFSGLVTQVWIGGGTIADQYAEVQNTVISALPETLTETIKVFVQEFNMIPDIIAEQTQSDTKPWSLDWMLVLPAGDVITASTWRSNDSALNVNVETPSIGEPATNTTAWISGGVTGASYTVTNTIATQAGRTLEASFTLYVKPYMTPPCGC